MELTEERISAAGQEMFDLIDWYEQICRDDAFNDIETLVRNHGLLAALSVTQARKFRMVVKTQRESHAERRLKCANREFELQEMTDSFTGKTYTATKAAAIALTENAEVYRKEYWSEGEEKGIDMILKQANQTLFGMFHHISELKGVRNSESKTESDQH